MTAIMHNSLSEKKMRETWNLLSDIRTLVAEKDATFYVCMNLSEKSHYEALIMDEDEEDYQIGAKKKTSLASFFGDVATEERRSSDAMFEWLFDQGGLDIFSFDDKEYKVDLEVPDVPEEAFLSLQWLMLRRASHVKKLLEIKSLAESIGEHQFLKFLHHYPQFMTREETNRQAREILLWLEKQRLSIIPEP
eukprot:TRINITY_DN6688_c0_g1_i2.p1 TRINITY_DN6688_c0_g1~~TRINITY_DN6688_c0_g1_i2.p1  ORF type:complete len:192 (-),score=22.81 TRINITY_DN6688_c0_g1_i2:733-1308(-)